MISGIKTNKVYFSELLKSDKRFTHSYSELSDILNQYQVPHELLKGTKDIWCRDYMPIQVNQDSFIQFRYEPSYLKGLEDAQSIPSEVLKANGIEAKYSDINFDGGNVVQHHSKVILTDRIFDENPEYTKLKLIHELERLFDAQVIIIPQIENDVTGHAEGLQIGRGLRSS